MLIVKWDVTNVCNLNCLHCYNAGLRQDIASPLSTDQALAVIDDMALNHVSLIQLLGGEPLSRRDLFLLLERILQKGIKCSISTNAQFITKEVARRLMRAGLFLITISLDGADASSHDRVRGKGTFDRAVQAMQWLLSERDSSGAKTQLAINSVLMRTNFHQVEDLLRLCSDKFFGLDLLIYDYLQESGNASLHGNDLQLTPAEVLSSGEKLAQVLEHVRDRSMLVEFRAPPRLLRYLDLAFGSHLFQPAADHCRAASMVSYLSADGRLFPCNNPVVVEALLHGQIPDISPGDNNIVTRSFQQVYCSPYFKSFFSCLQVAVRNRPPYPCQECDLWGKYCKGGCPIGQRKVNAICLLVTQKEKGP